MIKLNGTVKLNANAFKVKNGRYNMMIRKGIFQFQRLCISRFFGDVIKIKMSALSPTMEVGKIVEWHIKEGDQVKEEQSIALVETDKATLDLKSLYEGYVAKIVYPVNTGDIKVNDIIVYLVEDKSDIGKIDFSSIGNLPKKEEGSPAKSSPVETKQAQPAKPAKNYPEHKVIYMPTLSPTKPGGTITNVFIKVGDQIKEDDPCFEFEADKGKNTYKPKDEGYVAKIFNLKIGEFVPGNQSVFILTEKKEDIPSFDDFETITKKETIIPNVADQIQEASPDTKTAENIPVNLEGLFISPRARRLIDQSKIGDQVSNVKGSGPGGRVIEQNVQNYLKNSDKVDSSPQKPKEQKETTDSKISSNLFDIIEPSGIRKIIAKRLTESKSSIPHYYLEGQVEMSNLLNFKKKIQEETGHKFSVNDFVIKAVSLACRDIPETSQQWVNDKIHKMKSIDIGFAVNAPNGLITPIVKNSDSKTLSQISADVNQLIEKAKKGSLVPDDYMVT